MTIKLLCVGKIKTSYLQRGIDDYLQRLRHYTSIDYREIKAEKRKKSENDQLIRQQECVRLRKALAPHDVVIVLDERGKPSSSVEFAETLARYRIRGDVKTLAFVIGGATGMTDEFLREAQVKMALSRLTFPHQLCRLIFIEQLYRAYTILAGESYHKA